MAGSKSPEVEKPVEKTVEDKVDEKVDEETQPAPTEGSSKPKGPPKKKVAPGRKKAAPPPRIVDANPGDHLLVKLRGFPAWPAIIADEDMLPTQLLSTRPVTAKRADGTYREDYAEGGKKINDRSFSVMYLATNEFGWVPSSILSELTPEKAKEISTGKMRKDLQTAFKLASENHGLDYYKELLSSFQEERAAAEEAAKEAAKEAAERKAKKSLEAADDESKKAKKRKASEESRSEVKKPKIKLSVGKTNGEKATSTKAAKPKQAVKKPSAAVAESTKEVSLPTMTVSQRLEKEVRFFRHKLQKGLLTRDVEPKEEDMPSMNDYLGKLEQWPELDVAIIRATKINKVLKAILKLEKIPRDEEFEFKKRSGELLSKWNKVLAGEVKKEGEAGEEAETGELTVIGDRTLKVAEAEAEEPEAGKENEEA